MVVRPHEPRGRNDPAGRSVVAAVLADLFPGFFATRGWGYGMAIYTAPDAVSRVPGRYGWDGGFGTSWVYDPGRDLVAIVMTQSPDFLFSGGLEAFWRGVYAAVDE